MVETGAEVNAVSEADTPLPIPTDCTAGVALAVLVSPPKLERELDPEGANVDPLRSALVLALFEIEAENPADVSGLPENTDAELLWLGLADAEKLRVDDDDTDVLKTEDVADDTAALSVEAESEIVGALLPDVAEPTADAEAALKLLRVTECKKPALTLTLSNPDPTAAETVELPKLGATSVEVSEALVVVKVDCAALTLPLARALCESERKLELGVARDPLALAPDVVVFAIAAEAVTVSAPPPVLLVPTAFVDTDADADVVPKLTLALAGEVEIDARDKAVDPVAEDAEKLDVSNTAAGALEDDFSDPVPVTVNDVDTGVVTALALAPPRAVLEPTPDLLEWSDADANASEEVVVVVVVNPPDVVVVADAADPNTDTLSKPRYIHFVQYREEEMKRKEKKGKLT